MPPESRELTIERQAQIDAIQNAAADADDSGGVKVLGPEDIRKALKAA